MDVLSHFDTGLSQPFDVDGGAVTFDLCAGRHLLHVLLPRGARDHSGIEFIRTAGGREITGDRLEWAGRTLDALIRDVPRGRAHVAEKTWHPGLARDYMLAAHGAVTFRIEITTCGQTYDAFTETARRLLDNTAAVGDWRPVLP